MSLRSALLTFGIVLAFAVMIQPQTISALIFFVFLGVIPGTDIVIPSWIMLPAFLLLAVLLMRWVIKQPTKAAVTTHARRTTATVATTPRKTIRHQASRRRSIKRYHKPAEVSP